MIASLVSFGTVFVLTAVVEGIYSLAERRKEARERKALKELYKRRMYRCGR